MGKPIKMGKDVVVRARKFQDNRLMSRKQCVVDIWHNNTACASRTDIAETVAGRYRADAENVVLFGFKTRFGGGRTSGFCLIYDSKDARKKYEPIHRLRRTKDAPEKDTTMTRRLRKNLKSREARLEVPLRQRSPPVKRNKRLKIKIFKINMIVLLSVQTL